MLCVVSPLLQSQEVPVPPFSVRVTAGSFAHFADGPEIPAAEGVTVMVTIVELSVLTFVAQVTLSQK